MQTPKHFGKLSDFWTMTIHQFSPCWPMVMDLPLSNLAQWKQLVWIAFSTHASITAILLEQMQLKISTSHMVASVQVTALLNFFVQKVSPRTGLDISKSTGSGGISPKMLKSTSLSIAPSLCRLFNFSISTGIFPLHGNWGELPQFPKAQTSPFPLATDQHLSSVASKLNECDVKAAIEKFLQVNAPISSSQWGFMSKCVSAH